MLKFTSYKSLATYVLAFLFILSSCKKDKNSDMENTVAGPDLNLYALTADAKLLLLNAKNPSSVTSEVAITGLQTGETLLGIDFRPATGQLYGIGSTSRIYIIDPKTGISRAVNTTAFTPALNGNSVGFDFNPTVDRIRLITSAGQNLRLNPETGLVATADANINGVANAKTTAAAYTENRAGAASTVLYDIDVANDKLHKQDPPNDGKLVEVGSLGIDADDASGFDISPDGTALAALSVGGSSALYTIDLATGKAAKIGNMRTQIVGIAIPTQAVAYAVNSSNQLLIFNPLAPGTPVTKAITGLQTGEIILGMDMRPVNGQLYGVGNTSRIYTINASSGVATMVGTAPIAITFIGMDLGVDFNPFVDRLRILTSAGQNYRVDPLTAVAIVDGNISIPSAVISGAAYTNNFAGAASTVLYDIDSQSDKLYKQDPPNVGTLVEVGALGINVESANGFDIGGTSGLAYGIFTVGGAQKIYSVNLATGAATAGVDFPQAVRAFTLGLGF